AHVWAHDYDLKWTDVLNVEKRVSETVVRQLKQKLSPDEAAELARSGTANVSAYEALVKGSHNSLQYFYSGKLDYFNEAERQIARAASLDPGYIEALVELGLLYGRRYQATGEQPWMQKAEGFFRRALALDACHPVANAVLSSIRREYG